jgi:hypothetical protein
MKAYIHPVVCQEIAKTVTVLKRNGTRWR